MSDIKCVKCGCFLSRAHNGSAYCPNHGKMVSATSPYNMERCDLVSELTWLRVTTARYSEQLLKANEKNARLQATVTILREFTEEALHLATICRAGGSGLDRVDKCGIAASARDVIARCDGVLEVKDDNV